MSTKTQKPLRASASPRESKPSAAPGGTALAAPSDAQLPPAAAAPGTLSTVQTDDALMGQQLTEQYQRAVGGMREVIKFGCMMMALRDRIESTRGLDHHSTTGKGAKYDANTGVEAWLKEFAPEVKKSTAYRFLHVAEAVASEFQSPAKISFIELATKSPEELPEKFREKQLELWDFVDGTSQRSWLDRFAPPKSKGGHHPRQGPPADHNAPLPEEVPAGWLPRLWARYRTLTPEQRLAWDLLYIPAFKVFTEFERSWAYLPDAEREEIDGWLLDMRNQIKAAREQAATKAKRK